MLARCYDPKTKFYPDYGGRGIIVAEEFKRFENFLAYLGKKPTGMMLDRINNDGPYAPGNVRWVTPIQQARNTRHNRLLTYKGETLPVSVWTERLNLNRGTIGLRLRRGWTIEETLSTSGKGR